GTVSCNFDCGYCLNSHTVGDSGNDIFRYHLTPAEMVNKAKADGCQSIAFNINEPAVSFPYFLRVAELARENRLWVGCATNGYFTTKAALNLAEHVDFINVSLKSIYDDAYKEICKAPRVAPVLRNIRLFHEKGVHLEITTPVTARMDKAEIRLIAEFIGGISRDIPWHLFRLLPEYKMAEAEYTPVDDLLGMRRVAHEYLKYVFIGNMVGSEWMDTICLECDFTLMKRINTIGCGSKLVDCKLDNGRCPNCGSKIPVIGDCSGLSETTICPLENLTDSTRQSLGLLDAYGYQKTFDFRTGETVMSGSPLVAEVARVTSHHPYPGDEKQEADTWVTDVALDMLDIYPVDLIMLDYAQASFIATNKPDDYQKALKNIFDNIERFLAKTGYEPLIFGCGGMETVEYEIDLESILGPSGSFSSASGKYAYISSSDVAQADPSQVRTLWKLSRVFTRKEFLDSLEGGHSVQFAQTLDDYVAIANPGVVFRGLNSLGKKQYRTSALSSTVPVYTTLEQPPSIVEIAPIVKRALQSGKKVALIIVEGAGQVDFPLPSRECRNGCGAFTYQLWQQYITLSTGIPYQSNEFQFPFRPRYWLEDSTLYPFSGKFNKPLDYVLGCQIRDKTSLSIGNRNIITHVCLEADISLECYCCYTHNYGTMAVFHDKALEMVPSRHPPPNLSPTKSDCKIK
ncbi:MAG: radical SAM protein, partial [Chloroflexota bacterium]|nr:radical SAM protein [Chloroflexota bacterium]